MPTSTGMKRRVRERMQVTGEKYTTALRAVQAESERLRDQRQGEQPTSESTI